MCNYPVVVGHVLPLFLPALGALPGTPVREHGWTPAREEEHSWALPPGAVWPAGPRGW